MSHLLITNKERKITTMANEPIISFLGNLTADPELRYTQNGKCVLNYTVAVNPSRYINNQWQNGDPLFFRCIQWGNRAELYAEQLQKGTRVYVAGELEDNSYIKPDGQKVVGYQVNVRHCGIVPKGTPSTTAQDWNTSAFVPPAAQNAPEPPTQSGWDSHANAPF